MKLPIDPLFQDYYQTVETHCLSLGYSPEQVFKFQIDIFDAFLEGLSEFDAIDQIF